MNIIIETEYQIVSFGSYGLMSKPICKTDSSGVKEWYFNEKLHREDGPAYEASNGAKAWFLNGKYHREDGPAIEYADGEKCWLLNGVLHREDGPAVEYADGEKRWLLNGTLHREDGPAVECANGDKYWFLNGKELFKEEWFEKLTEAQQEKLLFNSEVMTSNL